MYWQMPLWWINGTYTYMLFGQVEFNLAKSKLFPIFVKLKFFLSKILIESTFLYPSLPIKF
jgi:hypothetical protein